MGIFFVERKNKKKLKKINKLTSYLHILLKLFNLSL